MLAGDTNAEAARVQRAVLASKTGDERTSMAYEMSELVRQLTIDGIRRRFPDIDHAQLTLRLIERLHGRELARAVETTAAVIDGS